MFVMVAAVCGLVAAGLAPVVAAPSSLPLLFGVSPSSSVVAVWSSSSLCVWSSLSLPLLSLLLAVGVVVVVVVDPLMCRAAAAGGRVVLNAIDVERDGGVDAVRAATKRRTEAETCGASVCVCVCVNMGGVRRCVCVCVVVAVAGGWVVVNSWFGLVEGPDKIQQSRGVWR